MAVLNNKSRRSMLTERVIDSRTLPHLSTTFENGPSESLEEKLLIVNRHIDILKKKQTNDQTYYDKLFS
jgi:hypothetical protein